MDMEEQRRRFTSELWQRFEQLQAWAEENWPDKEHPLSSADFTASRKEILALRRQEPEPEQGGAQYVDMNPAPWP
ncbi:hypothetical protein SAMN05216319_1635 [Duganella sp. CF402]|uniref:hypothetical protein n=1 Tax=unclassified Duganella TaxID=2636909 RepID=UPI0008D7C5E6|nr:MULTISPECIES: hypothetical protein [unclassified Duganella]RZT09919.1 hypothetical protein EV582_1992 [Duganella sp. BK701]SEL37082.1 hypothetical protein SAMN05216319_1635 [Duganella sp. CF402]